MLFESEVHHPAGDEHHEQTVDASPEIEEDGGQDQNDAVQQVVDKSDFHFILVLEVGDDDVRSAGRKTVVETKADAGTDDCGTDKRPYIILLLALIPLTSWLLPGGSIGSNAAIVSLSAAATPFFARLTSNALFEIPTGLTETAKAMGATNWQIIRKFYLPESLPTLINAITLTFVTLICYTAMAGTQGGGGLGSLAINYGVYRNMPSVTWAATIVIVIIVMLSQKLGDTLAKRVDHR